MGVPITNYALESLSVDNFFLKGNEFLAIVDRHSGMLSMHSTIREVIPKKNLLSFGPPVLGHFEVVCLSTCQVKAFKYVGAPLLLGE